MAETLVSHSCECRPPQFIGGRFHMCRQAPLRPRQATAISDCAARRALVFSRANNKENNLPEVGGTGSGLPLPARLRRVASAGGRGNADAVALPQCAAEFCAGVGLSSSFCTRQFRISATNSVFSFGHAISWIQPNCLSCLPDSPSTPSTLPSSESL